MSQPTTPHEQAVAAAFGLFRVAYAAKWTASPSDVPSWALLLDDVSPEEILVAAKEWARTHEWPPSPAELRGSLPRFCRCGRCRACQVRAYERQVAAIERGALGADASVEPQRLVVAPPQRRLGP